MKAERARARAHRDRLAQMALERRAKKAEVKAEADALANLQVCASSCFVAFCKPVLLLLDKEPKPTPLPNYTHTHRPHKLQMRIMPT